MLPSVHTGPNPCDRGKPGSKYNLVTDERGIPLAVALNAANGSVCATLPTMIEDANACLPDRHTCRVVHADKAYDSNANLIFCRISGLRCAIAQCGQPETALSRKRWVIERTFFWLKRFRGLALRCGRRADLVLTLVLLGCACIAGKIRR